MRKQVKDHPLNSIYGSYGGRSVLYLYTKFEADSSIHLKLGIRVPKFRNWVT